MEFGIIIQGRGGHGSRPDIASNPVDCFTAIYSVVKPLGCRFHWVDGGTTPNIIPDTLSFAGECEVETWEAVQQASKIIAKNYNCNILLVKDKEEA